MKTIRTYLDTNVLLFAFRGIELASRYDLGPLDALHASAAVAAAVDEFITFEKPTKPLLKVQELKMTSLYRPANSSSDQG